jgi:hypothetical protein
MTSWEVPAGTVAVIGAVTTVPSALGTVIVVVAIWVKEPGNPVGKFVVVYRRIVTGCVESDDSTPNDTEITSYS